MWSVVGRSRVRRRRHQRRAVGVVDEGAAEHRLDVAVRPRQELAEALGEVRVDVVEVVKIDRVRGVVKVDRLVGAAGRLERRDVAEELLVEHDGQSHVEDDRVVHGEADEQPGELELLVVPVARRVQNHATSRGRLDEHARDRVEERRDDELEELLAHAALVDARLAVEDDFELLDELGVGDGAQDRHRRLHEVAPRDAQHEVRRRRLPAEVARQERAREREVGETAEDGALLRARARLALAAAGVDGAELALRLGREQERERREAPPPAIRRRSVVRGAQQGGASRRAAFAPPQKVDEQCARRGRDVERPRRLLLLWRPGGWRRALRDDDSQGVDGRDAVRVELLLLVAQLVVDHREDRRPHRGCSEEVQCGGGAQTSGEGGRRAGEVGAARRRAFRERRGRLEARAQPRLHVRHRRCSTTRRRRLCRRAHRGGR
mmetsp:Transcript_19948/g.79543  ORF Transcript_19948/g.79543 Transcript_19948/m.79543 type:complete len:436 (+) Transcript_19948:662-1969(+)